MALLDLFRSKVFHSNPRVRIAELKAISDANQNIFASIAKKDTESEVRQVAIQRLTDWEALAWVSENEPQDELRKIASKKLNEIAYREARDAQDESSAQEWFSKINSSKSIQDLAKNAELPSIRISAIKQVSKENFITELLLNEQDSQVAQAAIAKLEKQSSFDKVFKNAKSMEVRQLAKPKLQQSKDKAIAEAPEVDLDLAKRKVILNKLDGYNQRSKVLEFEQDFNTLISEWGQLQSQASAEELTLVEEYQQNFQSKKSSEEAEIAEQQAADQFHTQGIEAASDILAQLNQYAEMYAATDDSRNQFQSLQQSWNQWSDSYASVQLPQSTQDAIKQQFSKIRAIHQRLDSQALDSEQRKERRVDLLAQLKKLAGQAELQISDASVLRQILSDWNNLGPIPPEQEEQFAEFETLESSLEGTISKLEAEVQAALDSQVQGLESIIQEAKALEVGDSELNTKIRQLHISWKEQLGDNQGKFEDLYKEFKEALSPFAEVRQWEEWHNEKAKVELVEKAQKLSQLEDEEVIYKSIRQLQDEWKSIGPIKQSRHQELWDQFKAAQDANYERCQGVLAKMDQERQGNADLKKQLIEDVKSIASNPSNWKEAQAEIQSIQEKWKSIGPIPRDDRQSLWDEFRAQVDHFYDRRKAHFKEQEGARQENLEKKEKICEQAEALKESEDWGDTSKKLIALQKDWKAIGPVPRKDSDTIWARFREACDGFFERKKAHFNQLDEERAGNLTAKEEVISGLEALANELPENLFEALTEARQAWQDAGPVPRKDSDQLWDRFGAAQDKLIDMGLESVPSFAQQIKADLDAKKKLLERAKTVAESTNWSGTADVLKEMQQEWKELNRVGSQEAQLWKDFRKVCDSFFDRRQDQYDIMEQNRINNLQDKELLLKQAQDLASRPVSEEVQREIKMLRQQWKEIGHVPKKHSDRIWKEFNTACDACFPKRDED